MLKKWVGKSFVAFALGVVFACGPGAPAVQATANDPPPIHIAFIGDSMADGLWGAMFRRLGKDKCLAERIKLIRHAKNGTGLTRLDQYNWVDEVAELAADPGADLFVGSFGINDRQSIIERDKTRSKYPSPEFDARYQAIVVDLANKAIAKGGSILLLGLPVML